MAKPDATTLDRERYPLDFVVPLRFVDLDPNAHVNFAAMCAILGEGRGMLNAALGRAQPRGIVIVSTQVDFLSEAFYPAPIRIFTGIAGIGRTSWTIAQLATQGERAVSYCSSVMVAMEDGKPAMSDDWRATLEGARFRAD